MLVRIHCLLHFLAPAMRMWVNSVSWWANVHVAVLHLAAVEVWNLCRKDQQSSLVILLFSQCHELFYLTLQTDVWVAGVLHVAVVVAAVQKVEQIADVVADLLRSDVAALILKAVQTGAFQDGLVAHFAFYGNSVVLPPSFHLQAQTLGEWYLECCYGHCSSHCVLWWTGHCVRLPMVMATAAGVELSQLCKPEGWDCSQMLSVVLLNTSANPSTVTPGLNLPSLMHEDLQRYIQQNPSLD